MSELKRSSSLELEGHDVLRDPFLSLTLQYLCLKDIFRGVARISRFHDAYLKGKAQQWEYLSELVRNDFGDLFRLWPESLAQLRADPRPLRLVRLLFTDFNLLVDYCNWGRTEERVHALPPLGASLRGPMGNLLLIVDLRAVYALRTATAITHWLWRLMDREVPSLLRAAAPPHDGHILVKFNSRLRDEWMLMARDFVQGRYCWARRILTNDLLSSLIHDLPEPDFRCVLRRVLRDLRGRRLLFDGISLQRDTPPLLVGLHGLTTHHAFMLDDRRRSNVLDVLFQVACRGMKTLVESQQECDHYVRNVRTLIVEVCVFAQRSIEEREFELQLDSEDEDEKMPVMRAEVRLDTAKASHELFKHVVRSHVRKGWMHERVSLRQAHVGVNRALRNEEVRAMFGAFSRLMRLVRAHNGQPMDRAFRRDLLCVRTVSGHWYQSLFVATDGVSLSSTNRKIFYERVSQAVGHLLQLEG